VVDACILPISTFATHNPNFPPLERKFNEKTNSLEFVTCISYPQGGEVYDHFDIASNSSLFLYHGYVVIPSLGDAMVLPLALDFLQEDIEDLETEGDIDHQESVDLVLKTKRELITKEQLGGEHYAQDCIFSTKLLQTLRIALSDADELTKYITRSTLENSFISKRNEEEALNTIGTILRSQLDTLLTNITPPISFGDRTKNIIAYITSQKNILNWHISEIESRINSL